jgi:response regulator NasT
MIRRAVKAGVSSYVVDSVTPERLDSLVEVAIAQFEEFQHLRAELDDANRKLSERILVDRAKGLLMKARGLDEDAAYHALRKLAMERGRKLAEVARDVIDMASLLL